MLDEACGRTTVWNMKRRSRPKDGVRCWGSTRNEKETETPSQEEFGRSKRHHRIRASRRSHNMQASGKKVKIEVKVGNAEEGETAHLAANSSRDELDLLRKEQAQGGAKKVTESNSF